MAPRIHHAVVARGAAEVFAPWPEARAARRQARVPLVRRSITPVDVASYPKPS